MANPAGGGNTVGVTDISGNPLVGGVQTPGAGLKFTASPSADYTFSGWSVTTGSTPYDFSSAPNSPLYVAMTVGELGLTASFTRTLWKVTGVTQPTGVILTRGGAASEAESTGVYSDTEISYTVAASHEDYNAPTITATGPNINQTSNTGVSFNMPIGDVAVSVTAGSLKPKYQVSAAISPAGILAPITATMGGSTIPLPTSQFPGKEITLSVSTTDPPNYRFTEWTLTGTGFNIKYGGTSSTSKTITVVVSSSADGVATANYEIWKLGDPVEFPRVAGIQTLIVAGTNLKKDDSVGYGDTSKPNVFAPKAEDYGDIYQWGWNNAVEFVTDSSATNGWKTTGTSGNTTWNPCPSPWRLPTDQELRNLINLYSPALSGEGTASGIYTTTKFTNADSDYLEIWPAGVTADQNNKRIKLPAAGYRINGGTALARGGVGYYWSSVSSSGMYIYNLAFMNISTYAGEVTNNGYPRDGLSVRCVRTK